MRITEPEKRHASSGHPPACTLIIARAFWGHIDDKGCPKRRELDLGRFQRASAWRQWTQQSGVGQNRDGGSAMHQPVKRFTGPWRLAVVAIMATGPVLAADPGNGLRI